MTDLRTAAQQVLKALKGYRRELGDQQPCDAEQALEAALAEPDDEPTYCPTCGEEDGGTTCGMPDCGLRCGAEPVQGPEPPPEAQTEAEKVAYCAGWWAALEKARKAEPQEPDSPERRCGGPGCDMRCCQPVEEPVAAERDRLLSLAKRRADHEASEAAHHAGRWHAAHEHHLTRHAAMLELIGALAETATENSSEVEPAAEGGTPSWGIDWGRDGDKVCVSITKMLPNGSIEIVDTQYEPPGWRQQKTD